MAKATSTTPNTKKTAPAEAPVVVDNLVLELVIPAADAEKGYQQALKTLAKTFKADGFRKGKVPVSLVEQRLGFNDVAEQALNTLLPKAYSKLIEKENKKPLTQPDIKLIEAERGKDWKLEVQIAEKPKVELGNYKKAVAEAHKHAQEEVAKLKKEKAKDTKESKEETSIEEQVEDITLREIFRHLLQSVRPGIPELLLKTETRKQLDQLVHRLEHVNASLDDYMKQLNTSFEDLTGQIATSALANLQLEFILDEIAVTENLKPKAEEVEAQIKKEATDRPQIADDPYYRSVVEQIVARRKITDYLLALK